MAQPSAQIAKNTTRAVRTVVVTGGSSGIGAGIAQRLVQQGQRVVVWDMAPAASSKGSRNLNADDENSSILHLIVDVTDPDSVAQACSATLAQTGSIEGLVCSAGVTGPNVPMMDYDYAAWKKVYDVNVHGLMLCNQAVAKAMMQNNFGRIVNIASIAGKDGNPNASAYSSSKAAVIGLTKSFGKELAPTGVRVNCITPAAVKTPIFDQMTEQHIQFMLSKIPMGRFGTVDEVAQMCIWLLSDECSFSTGAVFDCSGGRAVY